MRILLSEHIYIAWLVQLKLENVVSSLFERPIGTKASTSIAIQFLSSGRAR